MEYGLFSISVACECDSCVTKEDGEVVGKRERGGEGGVWRGWWRVSVCLCT